MVLPPEHDAHIIAKKLIASERRKIKKPAKLPASQEGGVSSASSRNNGNCPRIWNYRIGNFHRFSTHSTS